MESNELSLEDKKTIRLYINKFIKKVLKDEHNKVKNARNDIEESIKMIHSNNQKIISRMEKIEKMVQQHSIGVQNVFNEFASIKKLLEAKHIRKLIKILEHYDLAIVMKRVKEIEEYMNSDYVMRITENFENFKYETLDLLKKSFNKE
jgi:hypothetical protein